LEESRLAEKWVVSRMAAPATMLNRLAARAPRLPTMAAATTPALITVAGEEQDRIPPVRPTRAAGTPDRILPVLAPREVLLRTLQAVVAAAEAFPVRVVRRVRLPRRVPAVEAGDALSKCEFLVGPLQRRGMKKTKKHAIN